MERLPIEILRMICAYVRDSDCDHEDFHSLSLVNRHFYELAVPLIYETLNVRFSDYESLQRIVTEIKENPYRQHFLIHARRLNLMAIPNILQEGYGGIGHLSHITIDRPDELVRPKELIPDTFDPLQFSFDRYLTQVLPSSLEWLRRPGFYKEKNWEPLISLIGSMSHLTEIHYLLRNMFPKCLLEVIHEYHATCKLSVWGTQFLGIQEPGLQGLIYSKTEEFEDYFEMDLLRSPCLHALSMFYHWDTSGSPREIATECLFPLITMAPNLKHMDLRCGSLSGDDVAKSNQRWGEYISSINPDYTATPVSLKLGGTNIHELKQWSKVTDFSSLRALDLPRAFSPLEVMGLLSTYRNLEYLHIYLGMPGRHSTFELDLRPMFASLNPLKYLRVYCPRDTAIIHEIFAHHGRTLRTFILEPCHGSGQNTEDKRLLYPVLKKDDLIELAKNAPYLQELRLPIRRSLGDKAECQLYEAIGKLPALRSLILDLDCNPRDSLARDRNEFSEQTPKLPIENVFINAAMDEKLAKAIWDVIDSSGGGKRLRNLRISIFGMHGLERADGEVVRRLAHSFLISRWSSCTGAHVKIREIIGKEEIDLRTALQEEYDWCADEVLQISKRSQEAIAFLWPSKSENVTWDFEWRSFPLRVEYTQNSG